VARLFLEYFERPLCGEVFNLGGGRSNSLSILETIDLLNDMGYPLRYRYEPQNRVGDHICYISDLSRVRAAYPAWMIEYNLPSILAELVQRQVSTSSGVIKTFR
jgi:CDP-paratose 2-epimerase